MNTYLHKRAIGFKFIPKICLNIYARCIAFTWLNFTFQVMYEKPNVFQVVFICFIIEIIIGGAFLLIWPVH